MNTFRILFLRGLSLLLCTMTGCLSTLDPLSVSDSAEVTVKLDFLHRPLPEIPLPNDIATRYDPTSPTKRRVNASMVATTYTEERVRVLIDQLDGWGVNQPITIPFTAPIDPRSILAGHRDTDYRTENDVIFLIDITPSSPGYGEIQHLDVGEGNYPLILEDIQGYWENDPRGWALSITLEEADEDLDGDGVLDLGEDLNGDGILNEGEDLNGDGVLNPPEDLDADGILDRPNYLPCDSTNNEMIPCDSSGEWYLPMRDDLKGRADALMSFYERETNTLIVRALRTLRERTTYAVILTKGIKDLKGVSIGSPFESTHHLSQRDALEGVERFLPKPLGLDDIAFSFTFTTQSLSSDWVAVREGLYGHGVQAHLAEEFPAKLKRIAPLRDVTSPKFQDVDNPYIMYTEDWDQAFRLIAQSDLLGQDASSRAYEAQFNAQQYVGYHVIGSFKSPQLYSREPMNSVDLDCLSLCQNFQSCDPLLQGLAYMEGECEARCEEWPTEVARCFSRTPQCSSIISCITPQFEEEGGDVMGEEGAVEGEEAGQTRTQLEDEHSSTDAYLDEAGLWVRGCSAPERCASNQDNASLWQELNEQSWPPNLSSTPVQATSEEVWFWLMMPREDDRDTGPVPLAIVGHGYGSNRFESLAFAGYFAQYGIATLAIDCPSHGLELKKSELEEVTTLTNLFGLTPFLKAANQGRVRDQDFKGAPDSGADFWTSYIFHTRDVVRQCVLDYMQLIRIFRSFDGERKWPFDLNGDGEPELAGDFNADGVVDISSSSVISITGASLGGITSALVGSLEPEIQVAVPISGGGGLGDIGVRSLQGGVREAVILRVMGPLFVGVPHDEKQTRVYTLVPELNNDGRRDLGYLPKLNPHDTIIIENLENDQRGCAYVQEGGLFRVAVESDRGDRIRISAYAGPQLKGDQECGLRDTTKEPIAVLDRLESEFTFLGRTYPKDSPLVTLAEGFGEHRVSPGLRRFLGLGQLVLDGGDPATYARHLLDEPLKYPLKGDQTGTHTLIVTTMGDMNVPASSGSTLGRAAGLIDYLTPLPEHEGKTANQVLLDTFTTEAVHTLYRHVDESGAPVHMDIELFSDGEDVWTSRGIPRLQAPLRSGLSSKDKLLGYSGAIFPYSTPEGQHGFNFPGMDQDLYVIECQSMCAEDDMECLSGCDSAYEGRFDVGYFFFNLLASYMKSGGLKWEIKPCYADNTCPP